MDGVVLDRCTLRLTVPDSDWAFRLWLEHDLADRIAHQLGNAAP